MGQEGKAFPVCAGSRVSFPKGMLGGGSLGGLLFLLLHLGQVFQREVCQSFSFSPLCSTAVSVTSQAMDYTDAKAFQLLLFVQNRARKN